MNQASDPVSIKQLLEQATRLLNTDSARLEAEVLLAHVLQQPRSHFHAWPEKLLPDGSREHFRQLLQRRLSGEPVAYLTGEREFWSLPLSVTADTLIPRPETETLVAQALQRLPAERPQLIADLGTGSGAVALAIARERPRCRIIATDIAAAAIETARLNARRLDIHSIEFHSGNWCEPLAGLQLDMIVSNPPYIAETDPHLLAGDVRFEPRSALAAGPQGMDDLRRIAYCAASHLQPGGWLLMEHGYEQGELARQLLEDAGFTEVIDYPDEAGEDRVIAGRRSP
ncbi:MAG: peptide chain release factor N(5)-glutamine methyltransferase [Gammaproteobacteria bacterium]